MSKRTKTSVTKACDILFSYLVRLIGQCENCGSTQELQCAHIKTRKYRSLRWDLLNAFCLCAKCHRYYHDNPDEFGEFVGTETTKILNKKLQKTKTWHIQDYLAIEKELKYILQKLDKAHTGRSTWRRSELYKVYKELKDSLPLQ